MEKHNQEYDEGKHTWSMGVNHFTDLTHEEFMKLNQLKVRDLPQREIGYEMQAKTIAAEVDWRTKVNFAILILLLLISNFAKKWRKKLSLL